MELKEHKVEQGIEQGQGYIRSTYVEEDEEKIKTTIITDYGDFHYEKKEIIKYKRSK